MNNSSTKQLVERINLQIWLQCMQMNSCSAQNADKFIKQMKDMIDVRLTSSGQTIIMVACSVASLNIVKACLVYKPELNLTDNVGRTALHYTAAVGCIDIFEWLIKHGANSLAHTIGGETPLAKACMFCQGDVIQWYLNNELTAFQMADRCGKKPLDILKISGEALYQEVAEVYHELIANSHQTQNRDTKDRENKDLQNKDKENQEDKANKENQHQMTDS